MLRLTNVKSLIKVSLQHALFCHVCNRSLHIISVQAEMAEEYKRFYAPVLNPGTPEKKRATNC